jgi:hypothetical protein
MTQLTSYLAENPINVEYPDDPRNYRKAMAAPDAPAWIDGTLEELKALKVSASMNWSPRRPFRMARPSLI